MGLAASQGRLLTITARLTSNEYESQQISNAKMRLSIQTQEASQDYISALNAQQFNLISFDNNGNSIQTLLTPAVLYEYNDTKNQYVLTNTAGKALISAEDAKHYEESPDLATFLASYGLKKVFKTTALKNAYDNLEATQQYKVDYDQAAKEYKSFKYTNNGHTYNSEEYWQLEKNSLQVAYINAQSDYNNTYELSLNSDDKTALNTAQTDMETARKAFEEVITYDDFIEREVRDIFSYVKVKDGTGNYNKNENDNYEKVENGNYKSSTDIYNNYQKYKSAKKLFDEELSTEGLTPATVYEWDDKTKAQWYTNLWYKLNGSSTGKADTKNYNVLDNKSLTSSTWISDAIRKGNVNIENAAYAGDEMTQKSQDNPFLFNLKGIQWETKIYSSCSDIVSSDSDKDVAQAEAEYQRRTAEINIKDEKYQRKLSLLDSEHHAMQTEYDSVKSAMDKNISRSYKAFSG